MIEPVAALLALSGVLALILSLKESRAVTRLKLQQCIPEGKVVYTDLDEPAEPLFSERYRIAGKPDYLVWDERLKVHIPVEVKTRYADKPCQNHVLQLAAYCLLVEETYGKPVPYGLLVYRDRISHRIAYDDLLKRHLLSIVEEMRLCLRKGAMKRNHDSSGRCASCQYRKMCSLSVEK